MFLFQELNKNEWNEDWAAMAEAFTVRLEAKLQLPKPWEGENSSDE